MPKMNVALIKVYFEEDVSNETILEYVRLYKVQKEAILRTFSRDLQRNPARAIMLLAFQTHPSLNNMADAILASNNPSRESLLQFTREVSRLLRNEYKHLVI